MMTVTLTGKAGPGKSLTGTVFDNVQSILIDAEKNLVTLFLSNGDTISPISVDEVDTVAGTKSGNTWTLTLSVA